MQKRYTLMKPYIIKINGYPWKNFVPGNVTVIFRELLLARAWIWLDFVDMKHDYIKEVSGSDVCFVGCGLRTGEFRRN